MNLLKQLFGGGKKDATRPIVGSAPVQTGEEQAETRRRMEAEMDDERARRAPKADPKS